LAFITHIAGPYLNSYAAEMAWREITRRMSNGMLYLAMTNAALSHPEADLFNEAVRIRERLAEIRNDVSALDRVLGTLGYTGDLDTECHAKSAM